MKFISGNKKLLSLVLINSCFFYLLTTPHHGTKKVKKPAYVFSETKLIQDAVGKIKKTTQRATRRQTLLSIMYLPNPQQ